MAQWIVDYLPTWNIIGISGVVAYFLLFVGVFLGVARRIPMAKGEPRAVMLQWRTRIIWPAFGVGMIHLLTLYLDHYSSFTWRELLIPFTASVHRISLGLGTLAFYGLLIVLFSSDLRNKLGRKWCSTFRVLSYPTFAGLLIHGMLTESGSGNVIMRLMYVFTGLSVIGITILCGLMREHKGPQITIGPKRSASESMTHHKWNEVYGLVGTAKLRDKTIPNE
ncbi:hypothetical protein PAECIP112173_03737 [Paenibacillus sp. JJ-100]|uniref:hypothetical protein n=1 Tax=Paenibacillus sp. JJ-100 TaxID=2974896 RepID=UPI0022FF776E|nr:hypothetical protein [Paenibacillus sp. JJ-100]CAI6082948.1 hypothetical protein PAECIP112173_03737 [Paenibacillus sp. JJ-100]